MRKFRPVERICFGTVVAFILSIPLLTENATGKEMKGGTAGTTGACCFEDDGSCQNVSQSECSNQSGVYQGDGTTCASTHCQSKQVVYENFLPVPDLYFPVNQNWCLADDAEVLIGSEGLRINSITVHLGTDIPAPLGEYYICLYLDSDPSATLGSIPGQQLACSEIFFPGFPPNTITYELNDPLIVVPPDRQLWVGVCDFAGFSDSGWAAGSPIATVGFSNPLVTASSTDAGKTWESAILTPPSNFQMIIEVDAASGVGACCFDDGSCATFTEEECAVAFDGRGVYRGGTACQTDTCPIGACCLDKGYTCIVMLEENCIGDGGVYAGHDTSCDCITDVCDRNCSGDINQLETGQIGDGKVNVDDLLELIGQWGPCPNPGEGCCSGDIDPLPDGDEVVNVNDLLFLIGQWGCRANP